MSEQTVGRHVEMMRLADIRPNPENVKRHELEGVGASIGRLGLIDLPVLDERTGMLVAGHGRVESLTEAQKGGKGPPEGVEADGDDWMVPVLRGWSSRDDEEARAAAIALNAWVPRGGWDTDGLTAILRRLSDTADGLLGVGYTDGDLSDLLKSREEWNPDRQGGGSSRREDSIDELAENYRSKQIRTLVLDYVLTEYRRVIELATEARKRYGVPGNAELLMVLLRRWAKENPAPAGLE